ncbi:endophilin-B2-like isoform X1 [Solea senegalensis]|uniref:Endophilin-B2-like isoform X1 n=1 Tax=Solea senegalensis TaxID=28829 RepID=A0AAV6R005_SOLSE|nr:endophilin-B2-like isoform X1 [Solea senegalensis]KAG7498438.1 endophilin-B2-like isoform X1 [Solea senegalensis]
MDFNVKKLASDAGVFFTRAMQFTEEKLGQAEKTELDQHLENLIIRGDSTKNWTEKILRQTEVLLQPNPIDHTGARIEEFIYDKLDKKIPSRTTNAELLGQYMLDAATEFGPEAPYGQTLITVGEYQKRLGGAEREFLHTSATTFLSPLRNFLEGDWKTISKERRLLENRRLDLDICKARVRKAKQAEAKAAAEPDFQETRPRNYVLSASASALLSEEVDKAEHELRVAQTEFDRQAEVTRLLLEGISSMHLNHLRCLQDFAEAQATYYAQCHHYMQELQRELHRRTNTAGAPQPPATAAAGPNPASSAFLSGPSSSADTSSPLSGQKAPGTLSAEQLAVTGTRKAKVLYDYDAHDGSELSLLADELITVYTVPGMDPDWLIGERGNEKGKVPVTYLELLS